jgi:peptide/nickel transport system ATP-binding protein
VTQAFLDVRDLRVQFPTEDGLVNAVDGVDFSVEKGKTLAIVGESGSGKSVTSQAIMGLINRKSAKMTGEVYLEGEELVGARPEQVRSLRGKRMAMIFQDPLSSLHPFYTIGKQLAEAVLVHQKVSKSEAYGQARDMLARVGIPNPERRIKDYPHNLSGGMRQRVMIAMALLNSPELLIADEPTTALDVTVQAQILDLLRSLQAEFGTAIVLITHDLGVVADMADDVVVMYGGRVVERGSVQDIYYRPEMPYTWGLLGSVPRMDVDRGERLQPIPGQPPSLIRLPKGCVFRPRCPYHELVPGNRCDTDRPDLEPITPEHAVRCHLEPAQRREIAAERLSARGGNVAGGGADPDNPNSNRRTEDSTLRTDPASTASPTATTTQEDPK